VLFFAFYARCYLFPDTWTCVLMDVLMRSVLDGWN
jgi:hypothetical protein